MSQGGKCENSPDRGRKIRILQNVLCFLSLSLLVFYLHYLLGKGATNALQCHAQEQGPCRKPTLPTRGHKASSGCPRLTWSTPEGGERLPKALITSCAPPALLLQTRNCPWPRGGPWRERYQKREDTSPCHMAFAVFLEALSYLLIFQIGHCQVLGNWTGLCQFCMAASPC